MSRFRALLVSTYDLGRQPFGVASAAAWLARDGIEVECLDLAVEAFDEERVRRADAIALYLPMHTATRVAARRLPRIRALAPGAALAGFGLYAAANREHLASLGVRAVFAGEFEADLAAWISDVRARRARGEAPAPAARVAFDRLAFVVPERAGLPPLDRYAKLDPGDGRLRVVGSTEASRGCRHRCRHCPVVPVYGGRFRVVPREVVLEDVARQVAAGARHVTFGDPDFLNGPGHAFPLIDELHRRHPGLTWDATIKIEHLLRHEGRLPRLAAQGCLFVTSAVESLDDAVLAKLDKGHTRAGFERALARCRAAGLCLHPTFVAFHPWLTPAGYLELLEGLERLDLIEHVPPVQLAIRLLLPAGSRLLELPEIRRLAGRFEPATLVHPWRHPDPRVDALQREVEAAVAAGAAAGEGRAALFERIRALAAAAAGRAPSRPAALTAPKRPPVPFLNEPWYC